MDSNATAAPKEINVHAERGTEDTEWKGKKGWAGWLLFTCEACMADPPCSHDPAEPAQWEKQWRSKQPTEEYYRHVQKCHPGCMAKQQKPGPKPKEASGVQRERASADVEKVRETTLERKKQIAAAVMEILREEALHAANVEKEKRELETSKGQGSTSGTPTAACRGVCAFGAAPDGPAAAHPPPRAAAAPPPMRFAASLHAVMHNLGLPVEGSLAEQLRAANAAIGLEPMGNLLEQVGRLVEATETVVAAPAAVQAPAAPSTQTHLSCLSRGDPRRRARHESSDSLSSTEPPAKRPRAAGEDATERRRGR